MTIINVLLGLAIIFIILVEAFETIILPRRVKRKVRLTRLFYQSLWFIWSKFAKGTLSAKSRESFLSVFGPFSLIGLLSVWAVCLITGFALLQYGLQSPLNCPEKESTIVTYFYMSGVIFFTLGFGDVIPITLAGRVIAVAESGVGLGFLAIIIGYLPVIYQAFSKREANISLLDARAGSPPTAVGLLKRHSGCRQGGELHELLRDWERWSAELMESHLSYPVLCFYRSQHDNQSWLASLTTILDTCSLIIVGIEGISPKQARLTFAIARHAVVDLSQIFNTKPLPTKVDRLSIEQLKHLRQELAQEGMLLNDDDEANKKLIEMRKMYEPYIHALSERLLMPLPLWNIERKTIDNWQTSAWEKISSGSLVAAGQEVYEDEHF